MNKSSYSPFSQHRSDSFKIKVPETKKQNIYELQIFYVIIQRI